MTFIKWKKKYAQLEWYTNFRRDMADSYERLGHKADGIKNLVVDIQSSYYDLATYTKS